MHNADCDVGYYGVGIEKALDEASKISRPLMLHIAEQDKFCPPEAQSQIKAGLKANAQATIYDYAAQDHAFARVGGEHYDKQAADEANKRTADFFKKHLA